MDEVIFDRPEPKKEYSIDDLAEIVASVALEKLQESIFSEVKELRNRVSDLEQRITKIDQGELEKALKNKVEGVNLEGADLRWANLRWTNLKDAHLLNATYNKDTVFPDGFKPEEHEMILIEEDLS